MVCSHQKVTSEFTASPFGTERSGAHKARVILEKWEHFQGEIKSCIATHVMPASHDGNS